MLSKAKVTDHIWSITADTQEEIAKAFIRFQEYYENPKLKGNKGITVHAIEKWWAAERPEDREQDSYYEAWCGFNLPGRVFAETLMSAMFRPAWTLKDLWQRRFWKQEDALLDVLYNLSIEDIIGGYFIGTSKDARDVIDHEIAHGYFTTNIGYKTSQLSNIARLPKDIYESIRDDLISMGYDRSVVHDEIQAYLSTYPDSLPDVFETDKYDQYTPAFIETFRAYNEHPRSLMDEHLASNGEGTGSSPVEGATFNLNGVSKTVANADLSYDDIIELAGYKRGQVLTVVYHNTEHDYSGTIRPGQHITVRSTSVIDVANTSNA